MTKIISKKTEGSKQRLSSFLDYKGVGPREFSRITGLSHSFLNSGKNIGSDKVEIIISNYPDLSLRWLITGDGDMLENNNKSGKGKKPVEDNLLEKTNYLLASVIKEFQEKFNSIDKKFEEIEQNFELISDTIAFQELNSITREIEREEKETAAKKGEQQSEEDPEKPVLN